MNVTGVFATWIGVLTALTKLELFNYNNYTSSFASMPSQIGYLRQLQVLDFGGGVDFGGSSLPGEVFRLTRLTDLYLDRCKSVIVFPFVTVDNGAIAVYRAHCPAA
jgi:hypothetical protein